MIPFTKMEGLGNDYIYVDGFAVTVDDPPALARVISDRHFGVGADGLILILPPRPGVGAHVRMRMFNADGSESEMCGNGIRCVRKFAHDSGLCTEHPMKVETGAGVLELRYEKGRDGLVQRVTVDMGAPRLSGREIPVKLPGAPERIVDVPLASCTDLDLREPWVEACGLEPALTCVSMGNPHAILFCRDVKAVPLATVGPLLEHAAIFPSRVNVHFVQVHEAGEVTMRTWERGSGITLACGTGASAVCVAGVLRGRTARRLLAHLPGGDLELEWDAASGHVFKTGPAREVFRGQWPREGTEGRGDRPAKRRKEPLRR